jgi:hypothetical protein
VSFEGVNYHLSKLGENFSALGDFNAYPPFWDA